MARARNIKPGFYKNEDLAECSIWARFIFPGLWMLADREGRMEDRPKRIKGELLPFDSQDIEPLLQELEAMKFISRYERLGIKVIQILKFKAHQAPHYSENPSILPPEFPESECHDDTQTPGILLDDDGETPKNSGSEAIIKRGSQPPDSLNPDSLIPESENHRVADKSPTPRKVRSAARFPEFWAAYPNVERKVARKKCEERWAANGLDESADEILRHIALQKKTESWRTGFVPAPLTYLNQRRWEDGVTLPLKAVTTASADDDIFRNAI